MNIRGPGNVKTLCLCCLTTLHAKLLTVFDKNWDKSRAHTLDLVAYVEIDEHQLRFGVL